MHASFYCTHSIGPLLTITRLRPVRVVGFENMPPQHMKELGSIRGAGIEMITMENGAVFKSIHGDLKREPGGRNLVLHGSKGMMESGRHPENKNTNVYLEGYRNCEGKWEHYDAQIDVSKDVRELCDSKAHDGADFYAVHFFIEKILGRPDAKYSIDVYTAVDMGICGLLAYRSALNGNAPVREPNLRNPEERDAYRNDRACTTLEAAGDQLPPITSHKEALEEIPDEVYDRGRRLWEEGKKG